MRKILLGIIIVFMTGGCSIPIKLIPFEDPKEVRKEVRLYQEKLALKKLKSEVPKEKTEQEKIKEIFEGEKFLLWKAFRKATLGKGWVGDFQIASFINQYYSTHKNPTRKGLYDYMRPELRVRDDLKDNLLEEVEYHYLLLEEMERK